MRLTIIEVTADRIVGRLHDSGERVEIPNDDDHVIGAAVELAVADAEVEAAAWHDAILTVHDLKAIRCTVKAVGGADHPRVRLEHPELGKGGLDLDLSRVGLDSWVEAQRAQHEHFLLIDPKGDPAGHWDHDGGLAAIRSEIAARQAQAAEKQQLQAAEGTRTKATHGDVFVNPYTFVPFPGGRCVREEPPGHDRLQPDRLAGVVTVRWRARTPLLLRGRQDDGVARLTTRPDADGQPVPIITGSSLKGAVRSLHETLAGGCLRVVDLDYVPVYREQAVVRSPSWTLGLVTEIDRDGFPVGFELCDKVVWVQATALHRVTGGPRNLRTGTRVDLDAAAVTHDDFKRRDELTDPNGVRRGEGWVVLVTDAGARNPRNPYSCAVGHLSGREGKVSEETWTDYLRAVDGSDDVRRAQQQGRRADKSEELEVRFAGPGGPVVGMRRTAARRLEPGDVLWADVHGVEVRRLSRAAIWRSAGTGPVRRRIQETFAPCTRSDQLCVSCRLFGSADDQGAEDSAGAPQHGYRGHVRVGDALPVGEVSTRRVRLAPMGPPRPGVGQFYLDSPSTKPAMHEAAPPSGHWGSAADGDPPRPLKGRKYYWHADPDVQDPPRYQQRDHQSAEMSSDVELVEPGAVFEAKVRFDNLTPPELGGLLAALDPSLVLLQEAPAGFGEPPEICGRLGGGRPFGLGTVAVDHLGLAVHTAESRYGSAEPPNVAVSDCIDAFTAAVPHDVRQTWPDLAAVLDVGHVNPERVWYPPAATWDRAGTQRFDESFTFFRATSGRFLRHDAQDMVTLANPRELDQYLTIVERGR